MNHHKSDIIDLGCGPNKHPGAVGVDHHPFEGVDQVLDLDHTPWDLESDCFRQLFAHHIVEHIADVKAFMNEIHRIGTAGAIVEIVTPHFSSLDSWQDPTHRWHLSCAWHEVFTKDYLAEQVKVFEHVSTEVGFSSNLRGFLARGIIKLRGLHHWEKRHAFVYRARNITTRLKVIKDGS